MPNAASEPFLLWSELVFLWSVLAYGIAADPLPDDREGTSFNWRLWRRTLLARVAFGAIVSYLATHSLVLSGWLTTVVAVHSLVRFQSNKKWTGEIELLIAAVNLFFIHAFIQHLNLTSHAVVKVPMSAQRLSAICIVSAILLFVVRGGTYIVRGCLRKTGTLPRAPRRSPVSDNHSAGAGADPDIQRVDFAEINRGRLIGNLERLVLSLVVAAGSYAALGFLVAAKGLVRSEDLQERDFSEYFLVGSLCSVLIALCAGLLIRYTLLALWPQLLSLQMQSS